CFDAMGVILGSPLSTLRRRAWYSQTEPRRTMIDVDRPFLDQDPFDQNVRSGIEGSGVGTWDLEFSTQQLTWSNTTRKLFGVSPQQSVDYDLFLSLLDSQDRERTARAVQNSIDTG